ncbi:MAG TPA: DUF2267 domain-containing protein [Sphingobacteriaceae bacterium]|nr:DUF2267 domain-containing protein [Sphingobacteriaceae bacterium]
MSGFGAVSIEELVADVAVYGRLPAGEAEQALRQVLRSIGRSCGTGACSELMQMLPPSLANELRAGSAASGGPVAESTADPAVGPIPGQPGPLTGHVTQQFGSGGIGADGPGDGLIDRQLFIGPMVQSYDTEFGYDQTLGGMDLVSVYMDDDAARRTQAVFAALRRRLSPAAAEAMAQALPPEIADWWRTA